LFWGENKETPTQGITPEELEKINKSLQSSD
jgi:hypothetical protein